MPWIGEPLIIGLLLFNTATNLWLLFRSLSPCRRFEEAE